MNLSGKKVLLRAIEPEDNQVLLSLINDEQTEYLLGGWSFPVSMRNQEEWTSQLGNNSNTLRCAIDIEGKAIGFIMLTDIDYKNGNAEVHVKLWGDDAKGKGYGSDALSTIVDYAFNELRLKCVYARVSEHNIASKGLFGKCGFENEGVLRCRLYKKGKYVNMISYSIVRKD